MKRVPCNRCVWCAVQVLDDGTRVRKTCTCPEPVMCGVDLDELCLTYCRYFHAKDKDDADQNSR